MVMSEFPKTIREKKVKIHGKEFKIIPMTNRQIIKFEPMFDELKSEFEEHPDQFAEYRDKNARLIWQYLVEPNIEPKEATVIEREILFIEIYKLTKGELIPLKWKCPKCDHVTEFYFNILEDALWTTPSKGTITISAYKFKCDYANYIPKDEDDTKTVTLYTIFSHIRSFEKLGKIYPVTNIKEFVDWCLDELDPTVYDQLLKELPKFMTWFRFTIKAKCEMPNCAHESTIERASLPDFSLTAL
jgi:hypothetical protein